MVKEIIKDTNVLQTKSIKATKEDHYIIQDLIDTAEHHKDRCCGLASIQIGEPKRIIIAYDGQKFMPFINPVIIKRSNEKYKTIESCMSLEGEKEVTRNQKITVLHENKSGKKVKLECGGVFAQTIQHEIDHCNGVLI